MGCKICGRGACMPSFHSVEEQNAYEQYEQYERPTLIRMLLEKDGEIHDLREEIKTLNDIMKELPTERDIKEAYYHGEESGLNKRF